MQDNFRAIVEEHTVGAVRERISQPVLGREVDEFDNKFSARLSLTFLNQEVTIEMAGACRANFGELGGVLLLTLLCCLSIGLRLSWILSL